MPKSKLYLAALALALLGLGACQSGGSAKTPEDCLREFNRAMGELDFERAKRFSTELSHKNYIAPCQAALRMGHWTAEEAKKFLKMSEAKLQCQDQQGQMRCLICCSAEGAEAEFDLVQEQEQWLVNISTLIEL